MGFTSLFDPVEQAVAKARQEGRLNKETRGEPTGCSLGTRFGGVTTPNFRTSSAGHLPRVTDE
jgi:hypothetical protein